MFIYVHVSYNAGSFSFFFRIVNLGIATLKTLSEKEVYHSMTVKDNTFNTAISFLNEFFFIFLKIKKINIIPR